MYVCIYLSIYLSLSLYIYIYMYIYIYIYMYMTEVRLVPARVHGPAAIRFTTSLTPDLSKPAPGRRGNPKP